MVWNSLEWNGMGRMTCPNMGNVILVPNAYPKIDSRADIRK